MEHGKLYRVNEAAEVLGVRTCTLRAWILRRKVPYIKVGRAVRVSESDLAALIEAGRVPARGVRPQ